jgi:mevalonate kinase
MSLVVGNIEIQRCAGDLVSRVGWNKERHSSIIGPVVKAGGEIATQAVVTLRRQDLKSSGELMNVNHALLYAVGVSCERWKGSFVRPETPELYAPS